MQILNEFLKKCVRVPALEEKSASVGLETGYVGPENQMARIDSDDIQE